MRARASDALRLLDASEDVEDPEGAAATSLLALVAAQDVELDDEGH
jgi:hypothetical protein